MDYLVDFLLIFAVVGVIVIPPIMIAELIIKTKWFNKFYDKLTKDE